MGWTVSPPFQIRDDGGKPAGLAIDLVREAARRRGIGLQWVFWQESSESAFRKKAVDLWPLIQITPERLTSFHISEPYLEFEYCFLVRADSAYRKVEDLAASTIGLANPSIDNVQLHRVAPDALPLARPFLRNVMEDVCQQRADAAFMDAYTAISVLLDQSPCAGRPLRWIAAPEAWSRLGIASTFESSAAADALRDEINAIAAEGKLATIIGRWGYLPGQHLESMQAVLTARRRETLLLAAVTLFALLFVLACWQTVRVTHERNRAKKAEQFLREAEQKLRLMANNLKEMVLAYDMNRRLIYANAPVETLTGYSVADLEKAGFIDWIHPEDRPRMLSHWDSLFQGRSIQDEEYRLVTRDGRVKWVAATWGPILNESGRQVGVQGSERDITKGKLAEEALRESEERFRAIYEHGRSGIAVSDLQGRLTFVNPAFRKMLGYEEGELVGKEFREITLEADLPAENAYVRELLDGERDHYDIEKRYVRKDGETIWVALSAAVLRNAQGKLTLGLAMVQDITARKNAEAQLMQAQKMESIGRLAGGVAHDFNNLLTVINGYSRMLLDDLNPEDPMRDTLEEIRKAGERAARLTQQLLAFSRKQVLQQCVLDLNRVVGEMRPMLARLMGEDVEVSVVLHAEATTIRADPHQLAQVVMNLAVNSHDAMPRGGKFLIETDVVERGESLHPGGCEGPYAMLAVSDNGVGMDEGTRRHIFEPFYTTKAVGEGTGLGLSMVQGIVEQSGGYIEVQSAPAHGTTFRIYLPMVKDALADTEGAEKVPAIGGKATVLVVEDQAEVRKYAAAALGAYGYTVIQAETAAEALLLCERERERIDLVLTDVVMPNVSGGELAGRLRIRWPGIKVLFMSGHTGGTILDHGVLDQGAAFIQKPFSPDQLAIKVREVLAG